jgi:hypothetical protein
MIAKEKVKRQFPGAKCIRQKNVYMILEWDAFFLIGPVLGCGYSSNEAWKDAEKTKVTKFKRIHIHSFSKSKKREK